MGKITTKSFLEYQYVSNPRFSPNGQYVAYISQKADYDGNRYKGDIYIIENGQSLSLIHISALASSPQKLQNWALS